MVKSPVLTVYSMGLLFLLLHPFLSIVSAAVGTPTIPGYSICLTGYVMGV